MKRYFCPRLLFFLLFFPGIAAVSLAQIEKVTKIEFPVSTNAEENFEVFPLGEQGALAVIRQQQFTGGRDEIWNFTRLDSTLRQSWTATFKLSYRFIPVMAYQNPTHAYWVFAEPDSDKFLFLQLDLQTGDRDVHEGTLLSQMDIQHFKVIGSKAVVAGYHRMKPVVVVFSFFDKTTRVLPGLYERNTELNNVDINEQDGLINVITYAYRKRNCLFQIKTYNYDGKLLKTTTLSDPDKSLISGQIVPLGPEDSFLIGNYSAGCTPFSQGLYVTKIRDTEPDNPEFIEFSELQNFFNYMSPKRRARIVEKIGRRKMMGKENRFRYRLLLHGLIQTEDEIILVAEVYYPNYRSYNTISSPGFGRQYMRTQDGYRYTHAIVCGFDNNGKYKLDNSFAIKDLVSYDLQEMVQLSKSGDYYVLAYPQEGNIHTEVIKREKVVVESTKHEVEPKSKSLFYNENSALAAWYGRYFLAFGQQKSDERVSSQREVYYISKLTYQMDPHTGIPLSDSSVNSKTSEPKQ